VLGSKQRLDNVGPGYSGNLLRIIDAKLGGKDRIGKLLQGDRDSSWRRSANQAALVVLNKFQHAAGIACGNDGLSGCKRFNRSKAVVFVDRGVIYGSATGKKVNRSGVIDKTRKMNAVRYA
jgi:hypothetical protein